MAPVDVRLTAACLYPKIQTETHFASSMAEALARHVLLVLFSSLASGEHGLQGSHANKVTSIVPWQLWPAALCCSVHRHI